MQQQDHHVLLHRSATMFASVVGGALVASSGLIHLHLWAIGYQHVPTIGPLFLLQGIVGVGLGVAVASWHRLVVLAAGAAFLVATIGGFALSATTGLFGFYDGLDAPWAGTALVVEALGAVVLVGAAWLAWLAGRSRTAVVTKDGT